MSLLRSSFISKLPKHKTFEYTPRYYDPKEEERKSRREIKLERGSFYKHSKNTSPLMRSMIERNGTAFRRNTSKRNQFTRTVLLVLMLSIITAYLLGMLSGIFAFCFVSLFMLVFISRLNSI